MDPRGVALVGLAGCDSLPMRYRFQDSLGTGTLKEGSAMETEKELAQAPTAAVTASGRVVIRCKYFGPTNHRGSRIRVERWDGGMSRASDPNRLTVGWDYSLSIEDNYVKAVAGYIRRAGWTGRWTVATCDGGAVAVYVGGMDSWL